MFRPLPALPRRNRGEPLREAIPAEYLNQIAAQLEELDRRTRALSPVSSGDLVAKTTAGGTTYALRRRRGGGGVGSPPPFFPLSIVLNQETGIYRVVLHPGRLVEPLEQKVHTVFFDGDPLDEKPVIEMAAGDFLVLHYETDEDGVIDEESVELKVEVSLPEQEVEYIEVGEDEGRVGVYAIPLGKLIDEDDEQDPIPPMIADAIRSDVWHRPFAVPAENIGEGEEVLAEFDGGYQFRTFKKADGDAGEAAGDVVEGRVDVEQLEENIVLRGTAKNMNMYVRRIRVSEGATSEDPPFLEYLNPTEVDYTLYWRDGLFLGSEEPEEEIGPCHHLVELEVATITQPTERAPCVEEEGGNGEE